MATTTHIEINHDKAPVRLFRSDIPEFFTHIHPAVVLIIWLPVVFVFLFLAIRIYAAGSVVSPCYISLGFLFGLFLRTLTEYLMHRFVFYFRLRTAWQGRLAFLSHGVYHYLHYATHHIPMRRGVGKALKRHHLRHHYKTSGQRFGVSSPVWDIVFGTQPP